MSDQDSNCNTCELDEHIDCKFNIKNALYYWALIITPLIPGVAGLVSGKFYTAIFLYAIMILVLSSIVTPLILCRHCPYYATPGFITKCNVLFGALKIVRHTSEPISRFEQILLELIHLAVFGYPIPFLIISKQWAILLICIWNIFICFYTMLRYVCSKCPNFTCIQNTVPDHVKEKYSEKINLI